MVAGLEADDVVSEHPFADSGSHFTGQESPVIRIWPGNMDEVLNDRIRSHFTDHLWAEVEVIILQHDHRFAIVVEVVACGNNLIGELLVDHSIPVSPRVPSVMGDIRSAWGVPQVMLQEPQQRI